MRMVSVPPYCGTAALGVVVGAVVGLVVAVDAGVVVGLVVGVDVGVVVGVVFVPQDASTNDSASRQLKINQVTLLFIFAFLFIVLYNFLLY